MTATQQNRSSWGFIYRKEKTLFFIVVFLFLLLIGGIVFSASPFTDDFEEYNIGDLSGQGGWATSSPYVSWQVSTTTSEVGDQSADCYFGYCKNRKTGDPVGSGKWVFWTFTEENMYLGFWILEDGLEICRVDVNSTGTIRYYNGAWVDTGWETIYDQYSPLQIEWDGYTDQCRIQYANSDWSDWFDAYNNFLYVDGLDIFAIGLPDGNRFIDNISDTLFLDADWEVPELEDCDGLPALDTLVCNMGNFIAGIFMPTEEKVETLQQTLDAFRQKFPFNYIDALLGFFTDVSEELEETKTIPIEILGSTSSVSFALWDATTTIGGEEETFKNVLIDFTTFIVLLVWLVWMISLIKRFF